MKNIIVQLALAEPAAVWLAGCKPIEPPFAATLAAPAATVTATVAPTPIALEQEEMPDVVVEGSTPLSGLWRFAKVPSFTPDMAATGYDDSSWATVEAPARWSQQGLGADTGAGAVVVYRRTVDVPGAWAGQPIGISAWFNPYGTQVFVNGERVEPLRTPFAPYADVSTLVKPGATNIGGCRGAVRRQVGLYRCRRSAHRSDRQAASDKGAPHRRNVCDRQG